MRNLTRRISQQETSCFAMGGFAVLFKALLSPERSSVTEIPQAVAVKYPNLSVTSSCKRKAHQKWQREIIANQRVQHPNILPFLGTCDNPDPRYKELSGIVLPYCANGNARTYLANHPRADRLRILCGIGAALSALHAAKQPVVHGDIKAVNVLIGDDGRALLSDFGLSRVCGMQGFTTSNVQGTCRWMAVELLRADFTNKPVLTTTASDIWAFAMTILEILTGELPFAEFKSDIPIPYSIYAKNARPKRPNDARVTDAIWTLLECCWQEDANARPDAQRVGLVLDIVYGQPDHPIDSNAVLAILRGQWDADICSMTMGRPRPGIASLAYKCKWPNCCASFDTMDKCVEHECVEFDRRRAPGVQTSQIVPPVRSFTTLRARIASLFCHHMGGLRS